MLNFRCVKSQWASEWTAEALMFEVTREGDIGFDIGANVGWIALFLAPTAEPTGKVIAFELVWPTYMTMCANIQNTISALGIVELRDVATTSLSLASWVESHLL